MYEENDEEKYEDIDRNQVNLPISNPVNKEYEKSLIFDSDLMMSTEESDLFPDIHLDFPDSKSSFITEAIFEDSVRKKDNKEVLGILMESKEESSLDLEHDHLSIQKTEYEDELLYNDDDGNESELSLNDEVLEKEDLWDTDLEPEGEFKTTKDRSMASTYIEYCTKLDVVPVKYYLQNMEKSILSMKYHCLGPHGTKALARSLESNITVEVLDLSSNWMHSNGAVALGKMLEENNFITKMVLSGNSIGDQGIEGISKALKVNTGLRCLDLSDNHITDQGCVYLKDMLESSRYLLELNVSRNNIDSSGARLLGEGISSNDILESLDLSWNKIRGKGAIAVATGIKENIRIKTCNLSYNGFAQDGGKELADIIRDNSALVYLNIEGNRIDGETAALIGRALGSNDTLEELRMGHNNIDTNGILRLLTAINSSDTSHLKCLYLTDIPVDFEIIKVIELIQNKRSDFKCLYGLEMMVGNTQEDIKKRAVNIMNPIILLKQHILIKDKRLIDVLLNLDNERKYYVTIEQFGQALQDMGVPFKKVQLEDLRTKLDKLGNGMIYYGDFVPKENMNTTMDINKESEANEPI